MSSDIFSYNNQHDEDYSHRDREFHHGKTVRKYGNDILTRFGFWEDGYENVRRIPVL